jgi:UDPglucose 6-dehydrogenase
MNMEKIRVSIIGSGTVGMIVGKGFLQLGHSVIFHDIDQGRVKALQRSSLDATADIRDAVMKAEVSFLCVPTPTSADGAIDLRYVEAATRSVAHILASKMDYHLLVVKSTVLPTTTETRIIPLLETGAQRSLGDTLGVCVNPEFLTEIHGSWTDNPNFTRGFFSEPVIVIGESDQQAGHLLDTLYSPLHVPIVHTNLKSAELIKYAVNCALASRISYWNEIFNICNRIGVDSTLIASTAAQDTRIGLYGTVHGKAFGGKCLPKDLRAFIEYARHVGYTPSLLHAVQQINEQIASEYGIRE